ncbi:RloB family protein [Pseudomonas sp.]|uniref:RloB family protein n=1 Tax=Pseudomonas sp. TaxID=306 RepID=UPI0028A2102A|nr:RloB family protein [Pseudomonas sp.]
MRKLPSTPNLVRTVAKVNPKVALYIVCEGVNTEPEYFINCKDHYGAGLVDLKIIPGAGVPLTIVRTAVELRKSLILNKKKTRDSFDSCFRVWAVFDRDEHPNLDEAFDIAKANSIDVAFSDPCFELWPLLHLTNHGSQDHRHEVQRKLSEFMPSYNHQKGAIIDYNLIKDSFQIAYERANALNKARADENCPMGRPSTSVGDLVIKIIQNGKKAKR